MAPTFIAKQSFSYKKVPILLLNNSQTNDNLKQDVLCNLYRKEKEREFTLIVLQFTRYFKMKC